MQDANSPVYQPKPRLTKEDIEKELLVKRHLRWLKSMHFSYVMAIIQEWKKGIGDTNQFSEEALINASDKEVKDKLLLCKRCEKEAEKLIEMLS